MRADVSSESPSTLPSGAITVMRVSMVAPRSWHTESRGAPRPSSSQSGTRRSTAPARCSRPSLARAMAKWRTDRVVNTATSTSESTVTSRKEG